MIKWEYLLTTFSSARDDLLVEELNKPEEQGDRGRR
jgi:hypothetical protein